MADPALQPGAGKSGSTAWWESPVVLVAVVLLSTVPLLYPKIPPLVDLLGHMGRYRVQLDLGSSLWLHGYYGFHWAAIGNLGVDLLVMPLARLIGLEPAVKLIVLFIPPLTVGGFLWVAHEVHGRIPPTAFFALPFAIGHPFLYGFVNFALSIALAFLAFGLWLLLARRGLFRLRSILFVPISLIVFFSHTYGWGVLGLLCFSAEAVRQHDTGVGWFRSGLNASLQALVMVLPLVVMLVWRSETHGGGTGDWFDMKAKVHWLFTSLRDRWKIWDVASVVVTLIVIAEALREAALTFSRNLVFSTLVLLAGYILLPRIIFGSAYADMRLIPYVLAVVLLAIRFRDGASTRRASLFAILALSFFALRIASTTVSLAMAADDQQQKLQGLEHIPMGSRVVTLVGDPCGFAWPLPRESHLGSMVIVRRQGFSNDQWVMEGLNLLDLRYAAAGHFASDPSQRVRRNGCGIGPLWPIDAALRAVPRPAFDYVWLIDTPPFDPALTAGMQMVWRGHGSILYHLPQ